MSNFNKTILAKLEKAFRIHYPTSSNATYKSLVNYATDLNTPIQRWYRYKEGYSIQLMQQLFDEYNVKKADTIVDPFCGSGSTILQAKMHAMHAVGFEINPFSAFLAKVKTQHYSAADLTHYRKHVKKLLAQKIQTKHNLPKLSTIHKLYDKEVLHFLLSKKNYIHDIKQKKVKDLLFLAWLSVLEEASNYRKAGNGLKIRKGKNLQERNIKHTTQLFNQKIMEIDEDLPFAISLSKTQSEPQIIEHTALSMEKFLNKGSVKGVLFSPPYANCFDYTEIYKVELWLGGFVKEYADLKELRQRAIRSHLNGYNKSEATSSNHFKELNSLIAELAEADLWDKRIPMMVQAYFDDMFASLNKIYHALQKKGFCIIVVSNSAYGGIVIPTDLLLAKYAESIGFKVEKIDVARFIITSSQQYKKTEKQRQYLRESIIHLQKL